jgi:hypothetical protein
MISKGSKVAGRTVGWDVRFSRFRVYKQTDSHRPGWVMYGQSGGVVRRPGRSKCSGCLS